MAPLGVVVMNMGGPDNLEAVEPYIAAILSDRDVIRMPLGSRLQSWLARRIAKRRADHVRRQYATIGGRSPLAEITMRQAKGLCDVLAERGIAAQPFVAMRYTPPSTSDALRAAGQAGCERLVAVSLYPHECSATTGSSMKELARQLLALQPAYTPAVWPVRSYAADPGYLDALAATVREGLQAYPPERRAQVQILFSAHGVPVSLIRRGDRYLDQVRATVAGVVERLGTAMYHLAFQSRAGPVRWLEPATSQTIRRLAAAGWQDILVVPVSFVSDHLETLYELDIELKKMAEQEGVSGFCRAAALNTRPDFLCALADLVEQALARSPQPLTGVVA